MNEEETRVEKINIDKNFLFKVLNLVETIKKQVQSLFTWKSDVAKTLDLHESAIKTLRDELLAQPKNSDPIVNPKPTMKINVGLSGDMSNEQIDRIGMLVQEEVQNTIRRHGVKFLFIDFKA